MMSFKQDWFFIVGENEDRLQAPILENRKQWQETSEYCSNVTRFSFTDYSRALVWFTHDLKNVTAVSNFS